MSGEESRILLVDDEPHNLELLVEALEQQYDVQVAINGERALKLALEEPHPDLILLDVVMPGMDGYEVCRRLKANPITLRIPIIFITAKNTPEEEQNGLDLGATDYIIKPFHIPVVQARVRNHLKLKTLTDLLDAEASHDGLTTIANRRRFAKALESEWKQAQRYGTPLSLIMVDIDFFKRYNDHYGHGSGDECLKKVAIALAKSAERPTDLVARYGGEEFVALLPETDLVGAYSVAKRFRNYVEGLRIPHAHSDVGNIVTVSMGVACVTPSVEMTETELLKLADCKLYQAKENGRNQIC